MLILDTNHVTALGYSSAPARQLEERIAVRGQETGTTIVTVEEQVRGWLARIHRANTDPRGLIFRYGRFWERIEFFASWPVLPWDEEAASRFAALRLQRICLGTMDRKIASIVLAHDATLLTRPFDCAQGTRNSADFAQVPGLKFENRID